MFKVTQLNPNLIEKNKRANDIFSHDKLHAYFALEVRHSEKVLEVSL